MYIYEYLCTCIHTYTHIKTYIFTRVKYIIDINGGNRGRNTSTTRKLCILPYHILCEVLCHKLGTTPNH